MLNPLACIELTKSHEKKSVAEGHSIAVTITWFLFAGFRTPSSFARVAAEIFREASWRSSSMPIHKMKIIGMIKWIDERSALESVTGMEVSRWVLNKFILYYSFNLCLFFNNKNVWWPKRLWQRHDVTRSHRIPSNERWNMWDILNFHEHFVASCANRMYQISVQSNML